MDAQTIYAAVARNVDISVSTTFPPVLSSATPFQLAVVDEMNAAARTIHNSYDLRQNEIEVFIQLVPNQYNYDLSQAPNNLSYWRSDRVGSVPFKDTATGRLIQALTPDQMRRYRLNNYTGSIPQYWTEVGNNQIQFYPTPAVARQLSHIYIPANYVTDNVGAAKATITAGTDIILMYDSFLDYYIYETTYRVRCRRAVDDQARMYKQFATEAKLSLVQHQKPSRNQTSKMILVENPDDGLQNRYWPFGTNWAY